MEYPLGKQYLPAGTAYRKNRTTNRTDVCRLLPLTDPQACPPAAWCGLCGGEVYRPGMTYCRRCAPRLYG